MAVKKKALITALMVVCGTVVAQAQTTVAASAYGAFRSSTNAGSRSFSTAESPSNAAGFLLAVRHIWNPLMGVEVTYSYSRADEAYANTIVNPPCPGNGGMNCGDIVTNMAAVPANEHEITGDWVFSFKLANLRPFALAGGGILFDIPVPGNVTETSSVCAETHALCSLTTESIPTWSRTKGVLVYGAGLDWALLPHIGLRFQYRGNVYKTAGLMDAFMSTDKFKQDAEPMIGVYYRF